MQDKHYVVSHCIFNMNTRAPGISVWKGAVIPLSRILLPIIERVHQFPCPETVYLGLKRWWFVKEQYDNYMYRTFSQKIASIFANYFKAKNINRTIFIGLGFSPSCAVREVQSDINWGGKPRNVDLTKNVKKGKGVFVEELVKEFKDKGIELELYDLPPPLIYPSGREKASVSYPKTIMDSLIEVSSFFGVGLENILEETKISEVKNDLRSGNNVVVSHEYAVSHKNKLVKLVMNGYGIILIEKIGIKEEEHQYMLNVYATQLINQVKAGQKIYVLQDSDELISRILERIKNTGIPLVVNELEV